ncbi:MAG TPA: hypothetical protein VGI75_11980 [Pirellulales bacterium]
MPPIELKSAQYLSSESHGDAPAQPAFELSNPHPSAQFESWHRAAKWISFGVAGTVIVCVIAFTSARMAGIHFPKSHYPIDWWIWLCGGSSDQTFEKFVKNAATSNTIDWDEQYRKSPAYQLKDMPVYQFNQAPGVQFRPNR